jgi:hypothetical protein
METRYVFFAVGTEFLKLYLDKLRLQGIIILTRGILMTDRH